MFSRGLQLQEGGAPSRWKTEGQRGRLTRKEADDRKNKRWWEARLGVGRVGLEDWSGQKMYLRSDRRVEGETGEESLGFYCGPPDT